MTSLDGLLSTEQAFQAMSHFLAQYYERAGTQVGLATVLGDLQMLPDGRPADLAAWGDWLDAVRIVVAGTSD